jgi:hypothetical protein
MNNMQNPFTLMRNWLKFEFLELEAIMEAFETRNAVEKKLRDLWTEKKITPKQYWVRSASAYYLYNPIWWILVLGAMHYKQGDFKDKAKIGLAMIGVGAVIGVIYRNYKKDIEEVRKDAFPIQETKVNFDAKPTPNRVRAVYRQGNKIKFAY